MCACERKYESERVMERESEKERERERERGLASSALPRCILWTFEELKADILVLCYCTSLCFRRTKKRTNFYVQANLPS